MTRRLCLVSLSLLAVLAGACSRRDAAPLPGDSVSADGAVSLSPRPMPIAPAGTAAPSAKNDPGPIESRLYPAETIMEHQAALALTPAQRDAIDKEAARAQADFLKLRWELDAEKEKLVKILDGDKIDEAKSRESAANLMRYENAIKAAHLEMLVRIKNVLTSEQQQKLRAIRDAERCAR
jgi:Spy/CpxP family protein refolding chaperone